MQIQTMSTGSTQWDKWQQGYGGWRNANDGEHECMQMGGDMNKCGWAMAGAELACGSSYTHSTAYQYPLPKNQATCILLANTKPLQLGFWFFGPSHPPLCAAKLHPSATSNPMYPT